MDYYTALINAVERSVHFPGPSQLLAVNSFLIIDSLSIMTAVNKSGFFASDSRLSYHFASSQVTYHVLGSAFVIRFCIVLYHCIH